MCRNSTTKFKVEWLLLISTFFSVEYEGKMDNAYICSINLKTEKR